MNISDFFIKRPIFAAVISIIIFVVGALAYFRLPLSEYPEVVPPTVVVRTSYPGANPTVIADTVASPLEQQINGVEGMLYMFSQATADGVMTLTITFALERISTRPKYKCRTVFRRHCPDYRKRCSVSE
jgi:multidrug efflux pump